MNAGTDTPVQGTRNGAGSGTVHFPPRTVYALARPRDPTIPALERVALRSGYRVLKYQGTAVEGAPMPSAETARLTSGPRRVCRRLAAPRFRSCGRCSVRGIPRRCAPFGEGHSAPAAGSLTRVEPLAAAPLGLGATRQAASAERPSPHPSLPHTHPRGGGARRGATPPGVERAIARADAIGRARFRSLPGR